MAKPIKIKKNITFTDLLDRNFFINLPNDFIVLPSFKFNTTPESIKTEPVLTNSESESVPGTAQESLNTIYENTWLLLKEEHKLLFENQIYVYYTWLDLLTDELFDTYTELLSDDTLQVEYISETDEYKQVIQSWNSTNKNIDLFVSINYPEYASNHLNNNSQNTETTRPASISTMFKTIDNNILSTGKLTFICDDNTILAATSEATLLELKKQTFLNNGFKPRNINYDVNGTPVFISILEYQ